VVEQVQVGFRVNCVVLEEGRHAYNERGSTRGGTGSWFTLGRYLSGVELLCFPVQLLTGFRSTALCVPTSAPVAEASLMVIWLSVVAALQSRPGRARVARREELRYVIYFTVLTYRPVRP